MSGPELLLTLALFCMFGDPPTSQPATSAPTSQPTSLPDVSPALRRKTADLVARLGAKEYRVREDAQRELESLGDAIQPVLIELIPHPNAEISDRLFAIVTKPQNPSLRVELAVRLLATADPDRIERAVYMLFEDPTSVCDLFIERTKNARGPLRIVAPPVAEQLLTRKKMTATLQSHLPRLRQKNAEKADQLVKMDAESNWYAAEAAIESAQDALADEADSKNLPTTQSSIRKDANQE